MPFSSYPVPGQYMITLKYAISQEARVNNATSISKVTVFSLEDKKYRQSGETKSESDEL